VELFGGGGVYFCRGVFHFQVMSKFSIVLLRPEIPHNTGAIGRLCVGLGVKLNLVRPLGFRLDDRAIERAGLDYWPHLELSIHDTWEDYLKSERPRRFFFLSTHGVKSLYDLQFEEGDALVFGNESSGLPKDFYSIYKDDLFKIPMPGPYARSINLANAVSIAAYECYRQLR
jgi:tRNA (cytidine/uridine-2'-O-)-methyltransferase